MVKFPLRVVLLQLRYLLKIHDSLLSLNYRTESLECPVHHRQGELCDLNAREGEVIPDYRPMSGQSPYIINGFLTFKNDSLGLTVNASYNVQGKKLAVIGVGALPDVYEQPFHSLNLKVSKSVGASKNWKASISAKNILLSSRAKYYESYESAPQIYEYFNQGMTITGSISYLIHGKESK